MPQKFLVAGAVLLLAVAGVPHASEPVPGVSSFEAVVAPVQVASVEARYLLKVAAKGDPDRFFQKTLDKLDSAVEKVEKTIAKGRKPDRAIHKLGKSLDNARTRYPSADFSHYERKLADYKAGLASAPTPAASSSAPAAKGGSREERKLARAISTIEKAIAKVEDSLTAGRNADSRIRYLEKKIQEAKAKFPGEDFSAHEGKLAQFQAGNATAEQEKAFEVFDNNFAVTLGKGRASAPDEAQAMVDAMRGRFPNADYGPYEDRIAALRESNADAEEAATLRALVEKIEAMERDFADERDYYFSDVEPRFKAMDEEIAAFKSKHPSINISAHEPRIAALRKQVEAKLARLAAKVRAPEPDQGMTSAAHHGHVGRVVFSHQPIPLGAGNTGAFIQRYSLGDDLHFRVYLAESPGNTFRAKTLSEEFGKGYRLKGTAKITMTLSTPDGSLGSTEVRRFGASHDPGGYTTWGGELFNDKDMSRRDVAYDDNAQLRFSDNIFRQFLRQVLGDAPAADTRMKLSVVMTLSDPQVPADKTLTLAEGELDLAVSEAKLVQATTMKGMCMDEPASSDPELETRMLAAARKLKDDLTFADRVVLRDKGWTIVRHAISGAVIERRMVAEYMVNKPAKQRCYTLQSVMAQPHLGNDKWSGLYIKEGMDGGKAFHSTWDQISCRCMAR
ncbi:MAG: hypothetical protein ACPGU7_11215 [Gammaproteobacteria bacterium]